MASKNAELRVSTGTTFSGADQLIYMRSHVSLIDGLLNDGKIEDSLLPSYIFGGMRFVKVIGTATHDTMTELKADVDNYISIAGGTRRGCFYIVNETYVLNMESGFTFYQVAATVTTPLEMEMHFGDWVVCINDAGTEWAIVNNAYHQATTGSPGLMSAEDKIKLMGIATGANNYSHPTQTALSIDNSDIETVDQITVNTLGHVTALTKQTIRTATQSLSGVMSAADKTKLDGIATGANKYVHYTQEGITDTLGGIEKLAAITINAEGHVTGYSKENIATASESSQGVIEIATATEAKAGTDNTRALTPAGGKAMFDLFAGLKAYASVATADVDIANNPSGKLAIIYV